MSDKTDESVKWYSRIRVKYEALAAKVESIVREILESARASKSRTVYVVFAVIVLIFFLILSLTYFVNYLSAPRLHLSMEDWSELDHISLGITLSDESHKRFEGFADTLDVSIYLVSPNYGIIYMSIPITNASALVSRDFALVSHNVDWSYSSVYISRGTDLHNTTDIHLQVDASNPSKATFRMPTDIQTGRTFHFWANLRPLNVSNSLVQLSFFMRLNESQFNITESFFPPPELQLSFAPFYQPQGVVQISDLSITIERSSSETSSMYFLRISDMYIEMQHFEQNVSLILAGVFFTSFVSFSAIFLQVGKHFAKT